MADQSTPDDYTFAHFPNMEAAYEQLKSVVTELDRVTDDLYADVKSTLGADWEGEAQALFDDKKRQWDLLEVEMGKQLFDAAAAVNIAKGNYQNAERRNISIWTN
ncbi:hypothetical protein AB0L53_12380 [Nonomuraea sp. NPDC052129]|uniref:WXG100 family type VII secretion target n=1 Tax=Nonomuraea sp. NPDC052129 TaxID=3154651 RepID=UPI003432AD2B